MTCSEDLCETLITTGAGEEKGRMKVAQVEGSQEIRVCLYKILFAW